MSGTVRAQKAIAGSGMMSRRSAEDAIAAGRVAVDGRTIALGEKVDPSSQLVTIDGVPIPIDPSLETHLLYKPPGVISSAADPQGRPVVVDLVESEARLYPVGRLDADSEGLILLTNDGELANRVTHPRYGITKEYTVLVAGRIDDRAVRRLRSGVDLDDGPARALSARVVDRQPEGTLLEMVMGEGRNREIRRMLEAVGYQVTRLVRTAIGPLRDRDLAPGESRRLTAAEVSRLLGSAKADT